MSESDWNLFLHEWGRYSRQTVISDAILRDELWSCMEDDLRHLTFSATTEDEQLRKIKDLALTVLHPSDLRGKLLTQAMLTTVNDLS